MVDFALTALVSALFGGGVMYAVNAARRALEGAEAAEHGSEEAAEASALNAARQGALDKRLYACERAVDELCLRTALGVKRKVD